MSGSSFAGSSTSRTKERLQCLCEGGASCPKEDPASQPPAERAFPGLHASWVTPRVLAMARPWQEAVLAHGLPAALAGAGIRLIVNLQESGEHAHCGRGVLEGGFSYEAAAFVAAGVEVAACGWRDMGVPTLLRMLEVVQLMTIAAADGARIAVHCHAGLGRTGLAIACYLVFEGRHGSPADATALVRLKRPGALQTRQQERFVDVFACYLQHLRCVLATPDRSHPSQARSAAEPAAKALPPATQSASDAAARKGASASRADGRLPAKRGVRAAEVETDENAGVSAAFADSAFFAGAASFELPEGYAVALSVAGHLPRLSLLGAHNNAGARGALATDMAAAAASLARLVRKCIPAADVAAAESLALEVNRGQWGGLGGAPLGALVHLMQAWLGGFREPVLCGAALHAVLRLASVVLQGGPDADSAERAEELRLAQARALDRLQHEGVPALSLTYNLVACLRIMLASSPDYMSA
ncbi:hypothetical protein WJX81_003377 [Elliptochloris bilobata]|uniref:Tyrosine specific protein phosphatases domain-containing protein n=1 Tax=Elliptochloris bilobata TaxID=381761 RepID=A0AAW1QY70_9CHLO